MNKLTVSQAYFAMFHFLEDFYQRTKSDDVAVLLGGMQLLADETTADPAAWGDWMDSVQYVLRTDSVEGMHLKLKDHREIDLSSDK